MNSLAAARRLAVTMTDQGDALRKQGRILEAMARYDAAIKADSQFAPAHLHRGHLLLISGRFDEARGSYERALEADPQCAAAHLGLGNLNYRSAQFALALRNYQAAIAIRPQFADAYLGRANVLVGLGRSAEARESYRQALAINPGHAEAHFNLGVLAMSQEEPHEAAASLARAIEFHPNHPLAHRFLGAALRSLGNLDGAEASLRRAWYIAPESPEVLYDLGTVLQARGNYADAVPLLARSLIRAPKWATKAAFANCAAQTRFTADDPVVRAAFTAAVAEAWAMPQHLFRSGLSLVMLDERIASCVRLANDAWPTRLIPALLFGVSGIAVFAADPLLLALLEAAPVNMIDFERFLTCARSALLDGASGAQALDPADLAALRFYCALAQQCFINEFIFDCPETERLSAERCRATLLTLLDAKAAVPPFLLLAVAAYFPLHRLPDAGRLMTGSAPGLLDEVLRRQVREPLEEQALRPGVQRLTPITDAVSQAVRSQYEQNPYPRWVKLQRYEETLHFNAELRRAVPFARFSPLPDDSAPEMLIAGCGTGGDALFLNQRIRGLRVLAVDLSLGSLSYAKRKTQELGGTNIEYAQADILRLGGLDRTFDIIVSTGVLHHLADPFEGWRVLLSRLRPGGFMCLALYSQIARRTVSKARDFAKERGYASTPADIRRFRQDVIALEPSNELQLLTKSHEFYSMSNCRDLAFHVQEQHLTLGQIESFLDESGQRFIGFELELRVLNQYRSRFSDDPCCTNLRNWALFEADHPDTFTGMYQFWIQR